MKVEVDVMGSSPLMVSVDVKQHCSSCIPVVICAEVIIMYVEMFVMYVEIVMYVEMFVMFIETSVMYIG